MFVLLLSGITNAQTFDFSCVIEKTRFEIIEELAVADKVTVVATEDDILTSQVSSTNFTFTEFPGEQLSTMSDNQFNITKAGIEATVAKYLANIARIAERLEELNAIADESTYTHVEGSYFNANNYIFRVIRTSSDGSLIDYLVNNLGQNSGGISDAKLESEDTSGPAGWDQFLIDAKQAVVDSEKDGLNEILADLTAARNDELLGIHDSVSVAWDSNIGHVVSVGNQRIHSNDFGHRHFGKMSQEQFDLGLSFAVRTAVRSYLSIPFAELNTSKYAVQITVGNGETKFEILTNLVSDIDNTTIVNKLIENMTETALSDMLNNLKGIINQFIADDNAANNSFVANFTLITDFENAMDTAVASATTASIEVSWEVATFLPTHGSHPNKDYVKVIFTDVNGYVTPLSSPFLNGSKEPSEVTQEDLDLWIDGTLYSGTYYGGWTSYIDELQKDINGYSGTREERVAYTLSLITGNTTVNHEPDTAYTAGEDPNGDVFIISYEGASSTSFTIPARPSANGFQYGFIEDSTPAELIKFYEHVKILVAQAQLAYNAAQ